MGTKLLLETNHSLLKTMIPNIISVAIVIAVLIIIHEIGHLLIAKSSRVLVEKFSIGFGPVLIKKKIGETVYQLSLIPFGGYIKMFGEETEVEGGFLTQPAKKKIGVVIAGPIANLILGFILTLILFLTFGVKYAEPRISLEPNSWEAESGLKNGDLILSIASDTITDFAAIENILTKSFGETLNIRVRRNGEVCQIPFWVARESLTITPFVLPIVGQVKRGGPAARIGLKAGDIIKVIDGKSVANWDEFVQVIRVSAGKKIPIQWQRNDSLYSDSVIPESVTDELTGERIGQIGIWVALPKKPLSLLSAIQESANRCLNVIIQTFVVISKVITGKISRKAIGGPIMVAKLTYEGVNWGVEYFLALWAILSINLFVVNLFPIPVLDGGRILIFIIEAIRRKRLSKKQLDFALNIGWGLILLLLFFTFFNDILRFVRP
jgi:regulator of sigma E protease